MLFDMCGGRQRADAAAAEKKRKRSEREQAEKNGAESHAGAFENGADRRDGPGIGYMDPFSELLTVFAIFLRSPEGSRISPLSSR